MRQPVGIVGFGEAGSAIAGGLAREGVSVVATDARLASDEGEGLRALAAELGVELVDDVRDVSSRCRTILSLVTSSAAVPVAEALAPHVGRDHLVVDANSTSPARVAEVANRLADSGALVCDVAVMSAVPPHGHRVPMLASGPGAHRFAALDAGFCVEVVDGEVGAASAIKMLRSSVIKGVEALLLEFGLAARHFGATGAVLRSITGTLPSEDWEELGRYLLIRTATHGERRGHELEQVAELFRSVGVEPLIADAGARRLLRAAKDGYLADVGSNIDDLDAVFGALDVPDELDPGDR